MKSEGNKQVDKKKKDGAKNFNRGIGILFNDDEKIKLKELMDEKLNDSATSSTFKNYCKNINSIIDNNFSKEKKEEIKKIRKDFSKQLNRYMLNTLCVLTSGIGYSVVSDALTSEPKIEISKENACKIVRDNGKFYELKYNLLFHKFKIVQKWL